MSRPLGITDARDPARGGFGACPAGWAHDLGGVRASPARAGFGAGGVVLGCLARRARGLLRDLGVSAGICVNVVVEGGLGLGVGGRGGAWASRPPRAWAFELSGSPRGFV